MEKLKDQCLQEKPELIDSGKGFDHRRKVNHGNSFHIYLYALGVFFLLLIFSTGIGQAASAKDTKNTKTAPAAATKNIKNKVHSTTAGPTTLKNEARGTLDHLHPIKIISFRKKVPQGMMQMNSGMGGSTSGSSNIPGSTTINKGENITLSWHIKACEAEVIAVYVSGGLADSGTETTSHGCRYYRGERTLTPRKTKTYYLKVMGRTDGGTPVETTKSYKVQVLAPMTDILRPEVNQDTMAVSVSVRNTGMVDIGPGQLIVNYEINAPRRSGTMTPIRGSFTTPSMTINRGDQVELGTFSLADYRERLLAYEKCHILITLADASGEEIDSEGVTHTWETKTFAINNILMPILNSDSAYDIRLNNYGGGVHPRVSNDCHVTVNLMGAEFSQSFDLEPYVEEVLLAIAPSPVPIKQKVAVYANAITASQDAPPDFLSIRDGKLVIHMEFPNSGSRELKLGFHNWGRHDEFRDNPVADVELGPFSVDILITPEFRDGKISYGSVEVQADGVSGSLVGSLDSMLNPLVQNYLNDILRDLIVSYLTSVIDSDTLRTSFENGIADALQGRGLDITQVLSVSASGDTITVEYR